MAKVGFIGLGVMGYPMAGHLAGAGHTVTVYNRTGSKAEAWVAEYGRADAGTGDAGTGEHRGAVASTPAEAARHADLVMTMVGNDDDVRAVVLGPDGALGAMAPGTILVDHTTASADLARELHGICAEAGVGFVDAPVSGGESGARNGALTVMCGGEPEQFEPAAAVMDAYAVAVALLGGPGSGQLTKMVNQLCIAGLVQGLAEGIHLGMKAGLDIDQVVSVISKGAAGSWQMANRGSTMAEGRFDFGFAVDLMRKDLGIALTEASRLGARVPVAALVDQFYGQIQARGGNRWDTSSLIDLLTNP